jgi:hypothetical protein
MKKITVLLISYIFISCNNEPLENGINKSEVQNLANEYGYKLEHSKSAILRFQIQKN